MIACRVSVGRLSAGALLPTLRDANPPYYDISLFAIVFTILLRMTVKRLALLTYSRILFERKGFAPFRLVELRKGSPSPLRYQGRAPSLRQKR